MNLLAYEQVGVARAHLEHRRSSRIRDGVRASCRPVCFGIVSPAISVGGPRGGCRASCGWRPVGPGHRVLECTQDSIGTCEPRGLMRLPSVQQCCLRHTRMGGSRVGEWGAPSLGRRSPAWHSWGQLARCTTRSRRAFNRVMIHGAAHRCEA